MESSCCPSRLFFAFLGKTWVFTQLGGLSDAVLFLSSACLDYVSSVDVCFCLKDKLLVVLLN